MVGDHRHWGDDLCPQLSLTILFVDFEHVARRRNACTSIPTLAHRSMRMGLFDFFFGDSHRAKAQRDQWRPSVIGKNLISPINAYGTCFSCAGSGSKTLECRACTGTGTHQGQCRGCQGTGRFELPAKPCFTCEGTGQKFGTRCLKCEGTGNFKPAVSQPCRKCEGKGTFSATCRKCNGRGSFAVTCRKCEGSGWHKFKG